MGIFRFFRERRRARVLAERPIPDGLWDWALRSHRVLSGLNETEAARLRALATVFLAEKDFRASGGVELDDEFRVSVAVQACLPVLELGLDAYRGWTTIFVTDDAYAVTRRETDAAGIVTEYEDEFAGEVLELGPMVLSMRDVDASGYGDGYNVVIHEAAHTIDALSGDCDGMPPLPPSIPAAEWRDAFSEAFAAFRAALDAPKAKRRRPGKKGPRPPRGGKPRLDEYAAESPAEFFAVCCEFFFERPAALKADYPRVYGLLSRFFRQDPYARLSGAGPASTAGAGS